ncbi:MAG: hypothetical protein CMJ14_08425 [Pelagibacterales bacterium]|nr:hypothetical protein [Pelagibacterales bacterium]
MYNNIHKIIITLICISFACTAFYLRSFINNNILPAKEAKMQERINNEIKIIQNSYNKSLYKDAKESSHYLLTSHLSKMNTKNIEILKLLKFSSESKLAILNEKDNEIIDSITNLKEILNSSNTNIKTLGLIRIAESYKAINKNKKINLENSNKYLEQAIVIDKENNLNNSDIYYLIAMNLLDIYELEKKYNDKNEAIEYLKYNITELLKTNNNIHLSKSYINLSLGYVKLASIEQGRKNLKNASNSMENALELIPRNIDPVQNARIHRMLGDIFYLRSKMPKLPNEAGPRYIQDVVRFEAKAKREYRKAEQMGIYIDIIPGVKKHKEEEAALRKKLNSINDSSGGGPMITVEDKK